MFPKSKQFTPNSYPAPQSPWSGAFMITIGNGYYLELIITEKKEGTACGSIPATLPAVRSGCGREPSQGARDEVLEIKT